MEEFAALCRGKEYKLISDYDNIVIKCLNSIFKIYKNDACFDNEIKVLNNIKSDLLPRVKSYGEFEGKKYIEIEYLDGDILNTRNHYMNSDERKYAVDQLKLFRKEISGLKIDIDNTYIQNMCCLYKKMFNNSDIYKIIAKINPELIFCHGDLHPSNIIMGYDNKIKGIIDWESAGYYTKYYEYCHRMDFFAPGLEYFNSVFYDIDHCSNELMLESLFLNLRRGDINKCKIINQLLISII
jgi:serine/threonine protein kinase